ncbi:uncharacterized protein LOC110672608 isoform X2 [Hevea brasiliensis]|uniref:uncharacterized protein LOC110672608 isoform X2 n=1 Tax=Hevea brasiliensis TaxID=3981 RepID=UPI0025F909A7|nr:uncharacterized protein LOC110672608 isoform X2 [Hevea brasiliensis]
MGKQNKSKTTQSFGKGKVTPMQIAFIVDRYLIDNNFPETRSVFRNEASSLISKSPVQEAPKSLLSLGAMLNEYISLKEQKVMVDQERVRLEQERFRVQTLLQGMQDVMNTYNASGSAPAPMIQTSTARPADMVPQLGLSGGSVAGCPMYTSPTVMPVSMPSNVNKERGNLSSSVTNCPLTRKRSGSNFAVEAPPVVKKSRGKLPSRKTPNKATTQETAQLDNAATTKEATCSSVTGSSTHNRTTSGPVVHGSTVAKSLFNQPSFSSPAHSTGPKTPPQAISFHNDKSVSPVGISSNAHGNNNNTPQETPTNCTVITSERVIVSPCKHVAYTMERNHCISSSSPVKTTFKRLSMRENVKGRLDFDGSDVTANLDKPIVDEISTSESDKEGDIFDIDLPNLDAFGANFFSELLVDLDLGFEGIGCPCQPLLGPPADTVSGSSHESRDGRLVVDQVTSEFSSTVTEVISGKDVNIQGPDTVTAVKSIRKCIILSPAKTHSSMEQENHTDRN